MAHLRRLSWDLCGCIAGAAVATMLASPAFAQSAAPGETASSTDVAPAAAGPGDDEIVVTARRRNESLMAVPVTVSAMSGATIETRGITTLEGIARTVPSLVIGGAAGSFQGGAVALRGIGAGDSNTFGDQAVAFNIDGVQIARSTPRQLAVFDLEQAQVLKGPQALYYGKNSPAGIVLLRTANPTSRLEIGLNTQYEFVGDEWRAEGYISTPLSDALGLRIAATGGRARGWFDNQAPGGTLYSLNHDRSPRQYDFAGRATLKFDDGGPVSALFKFTYSFMEGGGQYSSNQVVRCPLGQPQSFPGSDCKANHTVYEIAAGPQFGTTSYTYGDGVPFLRTKQMLGGLELNFKLSDTLTLASTTGYWDANVHGSGVATPGDAAHVTSILAIDALAEFREISEELRLTSEFDGPLNFMIGGHYQDQKLGFRHTAGVNALTPAQLFPPGWLKQSTTAYSVFASANFNVTDTLELSGGARYSKEDKRIRHYRVLPGAFAGVPFAAGQLVPTLVPKLSFDNVSPEVTLTWRPTQRFTAYASWKRGFLSGGFNGSGVVFNANVIGDTSYGDETVEGFEGGLKGVFFDGALRGNIAAYRYDIKGLQVTFVLPGPPAVNVVGNAASARSSGVEAELDWRTPVTGFSLRGAVSYNEAKYVSFPSSPCFQAQLASQGCVRVGSLATQNLTGHRLVRAPEWGLSIGTSYDGRNGDGAGLLLSLDGNYNSSIVTDSLEAPGSIQKPYWLVDGTVRYDLANGFSLAFIGRNLTNTYYFTRSGQMSLTGSATLNADQAAFVSRGRELIVRASFKFR